MKLIQRRTTALLSFAALFAFAGIAVGQTEGEPGATLAPRQAPAAEEQPYEPPPAIPNLDDLEIDEETKKVLRKILPIEKIPTNISPSEGALPPDQSEILFLEESNSFANRNWPIMEFHWHASELVFQPPYWEQTPLERYGQTISPKLQPLLSGMHFFGTFPIIPYKMGIDRPFDRISVLGYYQPGSPAPCVRQRLPWEWDAALFEAGFWAGGIAIFP